MPALPEWSAFTRRVGTMVAGGSVAHVLTLILAPLLVRLYGPADFGVYAIYVAVTQLLVPFGSLRYAHALMVTTDSEAGPMLRMVLRLACLASALALAASIAAATLVPDLHAHRAIVLAVPFGLLTGSIHQALSTWTARHNRYGLLARARILQAAGLLVAQLLCGFVGVGPGGLVWGDVVGVTVGSLVLAWPAVNGVRVAISSSRGDRTALRRKYRDFPRYYLWGGLLDGLSVHAIPVLLVTAFGTAAGGFYALTYRVVYGPLGLVGGSVSIVLYQEAAASSNAGRSVRGTGKQAATILCGIAIATAVALIFTGPAAFEFVFGEEWRDAGRYAQILAPWFCVNVVASNLSNLLLVRGRQRHLALMQLVLLLAAIIPIAVAAASRASELAAVVGLSAAGVVANIAYLVLIDRTTSDSGIQVVIPDAARAGSESRH